MVLLTIKRSLHKSCAVTTFYVAATKKRCLQPQTAQNHTRENEIDRKPGSVLNDDLSRPAIADRLVPPSGHASSAVRPI